MKQNVEQKNASLLMLQKEYLQKTIHKIDEMIELASTLDSLSDQDLLQSYIEQINRYENEIDETYKIACDIEKHIKR